MKTTALAVAALLAAGSAHARDKLIPLAAADAALLQGKTIALTVHERPSFSAMSPGKAGFGLIGAAAMISAGNRLVTENHIEDPATIVRDQLSAALKSNYGANFAAVDASPVKATKAKELAALHPEADYVLDVRSGGWMYAYYPTRWNTYWVAYSVQAQLIDVKTGRQVSNAACNANTRDNPNPPSGDDLLANSAGLLKDITTSLGWKCVQLLAHEQFGLSPAQVAATPAAFADPLASRKPAADSVPATAPGTTSAGASGPSAEPEPSVAAPAANDTATAPTPSSDG